MPKRVIRITEYLTKTFTVEAETEEEAIRKANSEYYRGRIILYADDFNSSEITDITDDYQGQDISFIPPIDDVLDGDVCYQDENDEQRTAVPANPKTSLHKCDVEGT